MYIFVLMPFDSEFNDVYQDLIKTPLEREGYKVNRADDVAIHQNILRNVVKNISDADLIIGDLTARNPNVYYELGIAHALKKDTVQIVQDLDDVPFDLRSHNVILYSLRYGEAEELPRRILDVIDRAKKGKYNYSNPVSESNITSASPFEIARAEIRKDTVDGTANNDSEMGVLDAIVVAEDATDKMTEIASAIAEQFNILTEKMQAHTDRINRLNASPNQKGVNSKRLHVARQFARDVNEFSDEIRSSLPALRISWETVDKGVGHFISSSRIKDNDELKAIRSLVVTIDTVRKGLGENRDVFQSFRKSQLNLIGLSKATDRALANSDRTLQQLDNEFELGESVMTRIIDLATVMIDLYFNSSQDEEDVNDE